MSVSNPLPRIKRGKAPERKFHRTTYREAIKPLLAEFDSRCAYSDQHIKLVGETTMEVDHFDPRKKKDRVQDYFNLLPATRHCNGKKGKFWPTEQDIKDQIRVINPAEEPDWGVHIFEDPETFHLWGATPTGRAHIRILDLNAEHLVRERQFRHRIRQQIFETPVFVKTIEFQAPEVLQTLRSQLDILIRPIAQKPKPSRPVNSKATV